MDTWPGSGREVSPSLPSLIETRRSLVEKSCRSHLYGLPAADVEEAVQETLLRLLQADLDRIINVDAWLTTVAYNVCAAIHRRRFQLPEVDLEAVVLSAHQPDPAVTATNRVATSRLLERLKPSDRRLLVWHHIDQLSYTEIAARVHTTVGNARIMTFRARQRALAILDVDGQGDRGVEL